MRSAKIGRRSGRGREESRRRTRPNRYEKVRTTGGSKKSKVEPHPSNSDSVKLFVSNLDKGVTEEDVISIFQEFQSFKSATLHYDRYNNSLGTAEVVYDGKRDAIKAMKEYNNVPLDGKVMEITIYGLKRDTALASQPLRREGRTRMVNRSKEPQSRTRKNTNAGVMKEDRDGGMRGWGGANKRRKQFNIKEELKTQMKAKMWRNQGSRSQWKNNKNVRAKVRGGEKRSFGSSKDRKKLVISKEDLDAELDNYMKDRSV